MAWLDTATTPNFGFRIPLARAVLDDPAFSPDPRLHPHFPLAHAGSHKALPPKPPCTMSRPSPPSSSSPSSGSDSPTSVSVSTSPTPSSATSHSQSSPAQSRGSRTPSPVSLPSLPPPYSVSPLSGAVPKRRPPPVPEIPPTADSVSNPARDYLRPTTLQNANIPRKGRVRTFVRRLTSRHNLDRIDELDETDPFGGSYHHHGPYEATDGSLAQPSPSCDTAPRAHHSKWREFHPRPVHPGRHQSAPRVPSGHSGTGLSLNLQPGQILQQNTIYSLQALAPNPPRPQPNASAIVTRPDHSRSLSLPNTQTRPPEVSSPQKFLDGLQNRPSSLQHAPRERYFGDGTSHILNSLPLHHDRDASPYNPRRTETTMCPPPRHESRLHSLGPLRSAQRTEEPSFSPTSRWIQPMESATSALSAHGLQHRSVNSSDSSFTLNNTVTHSSFTVENKPLEPPRIRHLPKRLVMPAPLQPRPSQPQHKFPPADVAARQDEYLGDQIVQDVRFKVQPAVFSHEPRLLRKRSSAFPAKIPIPDHAPTSQDDALPNTLAKTANEGEGTKEGTRRRRLSKRKNDV